MRRKREDGGSSRLVMIFEKSRGLALILQIGPKVVAHRACMGLAKPVIKPLVVGVIETLLLERPLEIPIDLCHEQKVRRVGTNSCDGFGPEWSWPEPPRSFENIGQDQHGHVAAHAVTHPRNMLSNSAAMASHNAGLA